MQNGKNKPKSFGEEGSEISVQIGLNSMAYVSRGTLQISKTTERHIMKYRIEANIRNPQTSQGDTRGNTVNWDYADTINGANNWAYAMWERGYWVEIFNDSTNELLAGPFDPEKAHRDFLIQ